MKPPLNSGYHILTTLFSTAIDFDQLLPWFLTPKGYNWVFSIFKDLDYLLQSCNPKAENSYQRNMLPLKFVQVQLIPKQMISSALDDS